ncbi:unnamed protein product [Cladocopium goreaui]|uniref:Calmodulin n=1 Tax=Cladocopium goreaui TaxID=2562237 RepID=A0A9P1CJG5_9DINO|nr:unnamed protein product [Cladocopium goreaui]
MKTENRKTKVFPLGFFGITTVIRGRTQDDPTEDPALQHSGFTSSGWDKYYFFSNPASCAGPGKGNLHPTARLGRNRPAMNGPQTFTIEAFTPQAARADPPSRRQELKLARIRIEKKGARTTYAESYSQFAQAVHGSFGRFLGTWSSTSVMGPIERPSGHRIMKQAAATGQSISDTLQQAGLGALNRSASASEILAGPICAPHMGPHWPPPGPERPDPLKTRKELMAWGDHRTFVELHAKDRKAPDEIFYTITSIP